MKKSASKEEKAGAAPSHLIDARIAALGDWRGETLARVRALIREADPDMIEAVKWRKPSNPLGVPMWSHAGIVCTGETYQDKAKLTFARPLSGRVATGRPPGKRPDSKISAHSDAKPVSTFAECALRRCARRPVQPVQRASLDGNIRRAIDLHDGDGIDASAFKALIRAAVALNVAKHL